MKRFFFVAFVGILLFFAFKTSVTAAEFTDEDAEFMICAVACEYPDLSLAARVGILAVIKNRIASDGFPESAAGVISSYMETDGQFRFDRKNYAVLFDDPSKRASEAYRMTADAYLLVRHGADPTNGALYFDVLDPFPTKYDFRFDDYSEDERKIEENRIAEEYKTVIDGVCFK